MTIWHLLGFFLYLETGVLISQFTICQYCNGWEISIRRGAVASLMSRDDWERSTDRINTMNAVFAAAAIPIWPLLFSWLVWIRVWRRVTA